MYAHNMDTVIIKLIRHIFVYLSILHFIVKLLNYDRFAQIKFMEFLVRFILEWISRQRQFNLSERLLLCPLSLSINDLLW